MAVAVGLASWQVAGTRGLHQHKGQWWAAALLGMEQPRAGSSAAAQEAQRKKEREEHSAQQRRVWLGNGMSWRHQWCPAYSLEMAELYLLLAARWALLECQKPDPRVLVPSGGFLSTLPVHSPAFSLQQSSFPLANPESHPFYDACAFADVKAEVSAAPQARASFPRKSDPIQDQPCRS